LKNLQGGPKKVSLLIVAIILSTGRSVI